MKKYSNFFIVFFSLIILFLIFIKKELVTRTIILSLSLWLNTLVPSMFPMFILADILINYNFVNYIPQKIVNFFSKLFNISNAGVLIIFLSMISGFPANARNIKIAYDNKFLFKEEAEHLLLFNHFANPLFVIQTVGTFFLHNTTYGIIILFIHIISNFIIGILFRKRNSSNKINHTTINDNCQSFGKILNEAIKKSIDTLFMIAGITTLFLILSTLITNIFPLNDIYSAITKAILEMTLGLSTIASLKVKDIYKIVISTMIISFGGLSVHLQVISTLENSNIKYQKYLQGRIYQTIISGILTLLLIFFL